MKYFMGNYEGQDKRRNHLTYQFQQEIRPEKRTRYEFKIL